MCYPTSIKVKIKDPIFSLPTNKFYFFLNKATKISRPSKICFCVVFYWSELRGRLDQKYLIKLRKPSRTGNRRQQQSPPSFIFFAKKIVKIKHSSQLHDFLNGSAPASFHLLSSFHSVVQLRETFSSQRDSNSVNPSRM